MTPADIELMAREAGGSMLHGGDFALWGMKDLARFAALVQAAERERCAVIAAATVCDQHIPTGIKIYGTRAAKAIRGG